MDFRAIHIAWFTFSGRRNRKSYFLCFMVWLVLGTVVNAALAAAVSDWLLLGAIVNILLLAPIAAQRCRDFGRTGWALLLVSLPLVGSLFFLALFFIPGSVGPNRYGPALAR